MPFPTDPNDGDQYSNALSTVYQYQAFDNKWYIIGGAHNDLSGLNDGVDYEHITQTQKNALHTATVAGDLNLNDLAEKNHVSLANKNGEVNIQHLTAAQMGDLHSQPAHNSLSGLNADETYEHITQDQKNLLHATYTDGDVEGVITAEIAPGESINNAIDDLILAHKNQASEHHTKAVIDNTPYNAGTWDANSDAATKGAIRNKIESMAAGGGSDTTAFHEDESGEILALTRKTSLSSADQLLIEDNDDAWSKKRTTIADLHTYLQGHLATVATGTYTGNNAQNRLITDSLGFTPKWIYIYGWGYYGFLKWDTFTTLEGHESIRHQTDEFGRHYSAINIIEGGFTVGGLTASYYANVSPRVYHWMAMG